MNIQFHNCPNPKMLESIPEPAAFLSYRPDFGKMSELSKKYASVKQLIVIGHGGSVTSFAGMYAALKESSTKEVHFVSTVDPDYIAELKNKTNSAETLVIAISKSGETTTQIEALMHFLDYPLLFITGSMGPLASMAEKLQAELVLHPPIGGRFTGLTEVALLPSALCGFDVRAIYESAQKMYAQYSQENDASRAASILYQLEQQGVMDVFMPVYDAHLFAFENLIVQLCHESFGKEGQGQTYFAHEAPESQHHTNQRFFGGRKNIAGWFISTAQSLYDTTTQVPGALQEITMKSHSLKELSGIPLSKALHFEREGTIEDAKINNLPVIDQVIEKRTVGAIGELLAFWQLYAVYAAALRGVNPFDQPQVENSKKISFSKRLGYKGIV